LKKKVLEETLAKVKEIDLDELIHYVTVLTKANEQDGEYYEYETTANWTCKCFRNKKKNKT
jgi:hypothetical protein